ncbi:ATP-binding cassette domain-containing protein [Skermanella mucosa]|uniref:ATP-binding cassette domain-containing protein n=1 Tax=Skermanella mucosa TaxID=1789672 RepID=UPI00192C84E1|nr:ATP-binding cassette domain-containing protein [Skermanella mucosa]UEM19665.1 ATP-binding cassette domain-containing protein [Skermanella mucosa]
MDGNLYELQGAAFGVPGRDLLHPLDLTLSGRRIHGLIGPNGSGKSTLVKLLAGQQKPTRGTVRFAGRPVGDWAGRAFARKVAYLPQFTPAADGMTVRELVALGRFPWHGALGRVTAADRAAVEEAIARTGMAGLAGRLVDTLSGGERQRAWLAMMLAQDTECLLLDEPTSALDVAHQVEVLALVRRLSLERSLGVVVVLHDVNMAARYCDEILALGGGRLVARGSPGEIMRPEMLARIYGLPMGVLPHPATGQPIGYVQ